jgi:hypothetical protein
MSRPKSIASGIRRWSGTRRHRRAVVTACIAGLGLGSLAGQVSPSAAASEPISAACPASMTGKATCYTGRDAHGAYYAIAIPKEWNGSLVMHAHGGPDLGEGSDPDRSIGDLDRWSVMVDEGYAWRSTGGTTARCSPTVSSEAVRAGTTTVWTCAWSTSTTAETTPARPSLNTRCGKGCALLRP